jgi:hypothetical protein
VFVFVFVFVFVSVCVQRERERERERERAMVLDLGRETIQEPNLLRRIYVCICLCALVCAYEFACVYVCTRVGACTCAWLRRWVGVHVCVLVQSHIFHYFMLCLQHAFILAHVCTTEEVGTPVRILMEVLPCTHKLWVIHGCMRASIHI